MYQANPAFSGATNNPMGATGPGAASAANMGLGALATAQQQIQQPATMQTQQPATMQTQQPATQQGMLDQYVLYGQPLTQGPAMFPQATGAGDNPYKQYLTSLLGQAGGHLSSLLGQAGGQLPPYAQPPQGVVAQQPNVQTPQVDPRLQQYQDRFNRQTQRIGQQIQNLPQVMQLNKLQQQFGPQATPAQQAQIQAMQEQLVNNPRLKNLQQQQRLQEQRMSKQAARYQPPAAGLLSLMQ